MSNFNLSVVCLASLLVGCSGIDLGQIDETPDEREEMPGPGLFDNQQESSVLTWESDKNESDAAEQNYSDLTDRTEFELYKQWRSMRDTNQNSEEYREFKLWLEFRSLKAQ